MVNLIEEVERSILWVENVHQNSNLRALEVICQKRLKTRIHTKLESTSLREGMGIFIPLLGTETTSLFKSF